MHASQAAGPPSDRTASGPPRVEALSQRPEPAAGSGHAPANESGGLVPSPAIASQKEQQTDSELSDAVRARLCELPIVYILILAASTLWSRGVLGREDATIARVDGTIILALMGLIALLRSRCAIPLTWLQALELGAVGLVAGRVAFVEYRLMLRFSQRGDMMTAPMVLKSAVLLTAVLILTGQALRPQDLAPRRAGGRAAGAVAVRDPLGTGAAAPGGDGVALGGLAR